jgi:hypothetical protein
MPTKRYTPGLGRDVPSPGETVKPMFPEQCQLRKKGCTGTAVVSKRVNDSHTYKAMCPNCAGYVEGQS